MKDETGWTYEVHELSNGTAAIVYDEHGQVIADHLSVEGARLIAAAPDLLRALISVRESCFYAEDDGQIGVTLEPSLYSEQFDAICAAILKAQPPSISSGKGGEG